MSWRGKRKEGSGGFGSEENSSSHAPPKKAAKTDEEENSDDIMVCEMSKNRRVTVRNWQGKIWVDIREFFVKDGKQLPGKKGISLSLDQWNILRDHADEIDKALADS